LTWGKQIWQSQLKASKGALSGVPVCGTRKPKEGNGWKESLGLRWAACLELLGVLIDFRCQHMGPEGLGFGTTELRFDIEGQKSMEEVVG
jgi:hypothetical protein